MAQNGAVTVPEEYTIRRARDQDAQAVAVLMNACALSFGVESSGWSAAHIRGSWTHLDMERDTVAIVAPDGALAAYGDVNDQGSGKLIADGYVHPDHRGRGLGTALVRLMEARAREKISDAPEGAQVTLGVGVLLLDQAGRDMLEREGYHRVRVFWEMRIALSEPPAEPALPAGLRLRTFVPDQDDRAVFDTVEAAFADHWEHAPRDFDDWISVTKRPDFEPALWLLAEAEDGTIPAVALGVKRSDHGYIHTVGTLRAWRGQGLASALLHASFRAFWEQGQDAVALHVDAANPTGATRIYEAAGMHVTTSAVIYQKVLRPGVDLTTAPAQAQDSM